MTSETNKTLYCSECQKTTDHVRISHADIHALRDIAEQQAYKNPETVKARLYKLYPDWLKDASFGATAVVNTVLNGMSNLVLGKDYTALWICTVCRRPHSRIFE